MKEKIKEFLIITLGTLIIAIGIYFFKFPNNFSTGGVSGIAVILGEISERLSSGLIMLIINVFLLIMGFIFTNNKFCIKTVYCSMLLSLFTYAMEFLIPINSPLTSEPVLELVFAILLPAIGSAMLFNYDASTGGTDIVAMIIKEHSSFNISKALFCADVVIVMLTFFVFGIETWLFCFLGFVAKIFVVNNAIESFNTSKYFTIITENEKVVTEYIMNALHRGATVSKNYAGAFSDGKKSVVLTVVNRSQAIKLKKYLKQIEPRAFVIISNTGDIIGKGFRECI